MNNERRYIFTNFYDSMIDRFCNSVVGRWLSNQSTMYTLIPTLILYIITVIGLGSVVYIIDSFTSNIGTFLLLLSIIIMLVWIIYLITANYGLNEKLNRILCIGYFIILAFLNGACFGALMQVVWGKNMDMCAYLFQAFMCCLGARVIYEYSYKIYGTLNAFTSIMESVIFILTILSLILPLSEYVNYMILIPISISCLGMVWAKLTDPDTYLKRVNLNNQSEVMYWMKKFRCTRERLVDAVNSVGEAVIDVEEHLRQQTE